MLPYAGSLHGIHLLLNQMIESDSGKVRGNLFIQTVDMIVLYSYVELMAVRAQLLIIEDQAYNAPD